MLFSPDQTHEAGHISAQVRAVIVVQVQDSHLTRSSTFWRFQLCP
jgi:hypothetical protein